MTMTTPFDGFPEGGLAFFDQLKICQDRAWFKAHKADYEALWQQPMVKLFDLLHQDLRRQFPELSKTQPKVLRIYRDVRFSKDKAPFKTSCTAILPLYAGAAMPEGATSLYCDFGIEPFVAAGRWMMDGPLLRRFRGFIAAEKTGAPFATAVARAQAVGFTIASHGALKRPPPGIAADHPRLALLKLKGFALTFPQLSRSLLADGPGLVRRLKADVKRAAPLLQWLEAMARGKSLPKL